jgi:hypothetical protein
LRQLVGGQVEWNSGLARGIGEVVAERGGHRPRQLAALQILVHQQAGADVGVGVDVRLEVRMIGNVARLVVIEVAHLRAGGEQPVQCLTVLRQRNVEHGNAVARLGLNPLQQADIALGSGDQHGIGGLDQAQLVQGTDAVGIAVEDVIQQID